MLLYSAFIILSISAFFLFNGKKTLRYRTWYRPWLLLLLSLLGFAYFPKLHPLILTYFPMLQYDLEIVCGGIVVAEWLAIKYFLQKLDVDDRMEALLKKYNTNELSKKIRGFSNYLLWPYFIHQFTIYTRPGFRFFKISLWSFVAILTLTYFWTTDQFGQHWLVLPDALGMSLIPLCLEFLIYFSYDAPSFPEHEETPETEEQELSDFYKLYKRYTQPVRGFYDSIIFGYSSYNSEKEQVQDVHDYIKSHRDDLLQKKKDIIISSGNFIDFIPSIGDILLSKLSKGGKILMIADIPNHTHYIASDVGIRSTDDKEKSIVELFAIYLEQLLVHHIPNTEQLLKINVFEKGMPKPDKDKMIVLCGIEDSIDEDLIHSEWIKDLDLKIVFQLDDPLADHLSLKRQFSLWLVQQKSEYQTIYFKDYSTGGDEAITNTFSNGNDVQELKLSNARTASKNYFINFAYEKSDDNLNKIFVGNTHEHDLTPGIELSIFPIMENINHIHFFEGFNLDYIQSKNKLANLASVLSNWQDEKNKYNYRGKVTPAKLKDAILVNNLPFIVRPFDKEYCDEKHLSVIYDAEYNAPKLYKKYKHLGKDESFVCIVSKPHLFREFFAAHIDYFADVTIEPLEPGLSGSHSNLFLQLYLLLSNREVDIQFIRYLLNTYSIQLGEKTIISFIEELFKRYLHIDIEDNAILRAETNVVFEEKKYQYRTTLHMNMNQHQTNDDFEFLCKISVVDVNDNLILEIPKYLIFQNFLPQQNIVIDGITYEYISYNNRQKQLVIKAKKTDNNTFYKPRAIISLDHNFSFITIDSKQSTTATTNGKSIDFSSLMQEGEIETYYENYYQFDKNYHSPSSSSAIKVVTLEKKFIEKSKRKYPTKLLHIKWQVPEEYIKDIQVISTRIHQLIYEFLPTLFPHKYQYIQIASNNDWDVTHRELTPWIFAKNNFKYDDTEKFIELFIIEDSFSDIGVLKSIQINFEKILKDLFHLLTWLHDDQSYIPNSYSEFVKGQSFFNDKLAFLKYGLSDKEILWDLELLTDFLKNSGLVDTESIGNGYRNSRNIQDNNVDVQCDYCRTDYKLKEVEIMEDGLHRCPSCAQDAVDDIITAESLEKEAKEMYLKHFNIDFKQIPYQFNFVTATELHQHFDKPFWATNQFDERTCVGMASDREIDAIFVEKFWQRAQTLSIIIHEQMHIYQYQKLNYFKIKNTEPELIEGMATYAEYILLSKSHHPDDKAFAENYNLSKSQDTSEYGVGFRYVRDRYGDDFLEKIYKRYRI